MPEILIVLATVVAMEVVAWLSHRFVMHGMGWGWHASHHARYSRGRFEKNDLFALVFASLAIALIWAGTSGVWPLQWIGAGMTCYGLLYFVAHDGLVHRRWPMGPVPRRGYAKRLYQAHRLHHATEERTGAIYFGFLWAPSEADLQARLARRRVDARRGVTRVDAKAPHPEVVPATREPPTPPPRPEP